MFVYEKNLIITAEQQFWFKSELHQMVLLEKRFLEYYECVEDFVHHQEIDSYLENLINKKEPEYLNIFLRWRDIKNFWLNKCLKYKNDYDNLEIEFKYIIGFKWKFENNNIVFKGFDPIFFGLFLQKFYQQFHLTSSNFYFIIKNKPKLSGIIEIHLEKLDIKSLCDMVGEIEQKPPRKITSLVSRLCTQKQFHGDLTAFEQNNYMIIAESVIKRIKNDRPDIKLSKLYQSIYIERKVDGADNWCDYIRFNGKKLKDLSKEELELTLGESLIEIKAD